MTVNKLQPPPSAMTNEDFRSPQWQGWFRSHADYSASFNIALTMPANTFTVSGSPITHSGVFGVTLNSQSQGTFFAAPIIGSGTPTWRAIDRADIPPDIASANVLTWLSF